MKFKKQGVNSFTSKINGNRNQVRQIRLSRRSNKTTFKINKYPTSKIKHFQNSTTDNLHITVHSNLQEIINNKISKIFNHLNTWETPFKMIVQQHLQLIKTQIPIIYDQYEQ